MGDPIEPPGMQSHEEENGTELGGARTNTASRAPEEVIPLIEEVASVDKREVVTGRVRVKTVTDTVKELARSELQSEILEVTRVPVDAFVESVPEIRTDGDVTIVPVMEEVLVVEKRLVLKEELHIRRRVGTETVEVPVTLRKQRAVVERESPDGSKVHEEENDS